MAFLPILFAVGDMRLLGVLILLFVVWILLLCWVTSSGLNRAS